MKKHSLIVISIVLVFAVVLFSGCNKHSLSGKYSLEYSDGSVADNDYYTFFDDGTCTFTYEGDVTKATYKRDGKNIIIEIDVNNKVFGTQHEVLPVTVKWRKLEIEQYGITNQYIKD